MLVACDELTVAVEKIELLNFGWKWRTSNSGNSLANKVKKTFIRRRQIERVDKKDVASGLQ